MMLVMRHRFGQREEDGVDRQSKTAGARYFDFDVSLRRHFVGEHVAFGMTESGHEAARDP